MRAGTRRRRQRKRSMKPREGLRLKEQAEHVGGGVSSIKDLLTKRYPVIPGNEGNGFE
ncbi:hypothetical cytosolic protein [Syntrophus aciditrophicus SB]|uniref:Hypothetical cytosolic protein n=1 Tax=Syntrophus aciditrophicus (strain SB) TaxID=56780 RepID=Q2LXE9_SYNAS|nr:hypothetical cytosolic protein [Syntrophus aciditrophicus SB]